MNVIPDLIPLHDSRPGLRTLLQVQVRESASVPAEAGTPNLATLDFVASTATLDRYREVIEPAGWRLESYRRNPVFQNAHNYGDILFTLGKALSTEVRAVDGRQALCQRVQFAVEVNPVARVAYGLYKGGFLNAVSVGFIPVKWEEPDGKNGLECPRRRYLEQELLEVSAVAIPANPDALTLGLKSGAVERADLREAVELLRALVDVGQPSPPPLSHLMGEGSEGNGSAHTSPPQPPLHLMERGSGAAWAHAGSYNEWFDLAREFRRVMRKA